MVIFKNNIDINSMEEKTLIESIHLKNSKEFEPVFYKFSNGKVKLPEALYFAMFQDISSAARERILMAKTSVVSYLGRCNDVPFSASEKCEQTPSCIEQSDRIKLKVGINLPPKPGDTRNFLGIVNKTTGKMKLIECSRVVLHPEVPDEKPSSKPYEFSTKLDKNEVNLKFAEEFGGKRQKRKVQNSIQNKVDLNIMSEALTDALKTVTPADETVPMNSVDYSDILPPCNREASNIENVYKLGDIISDDNLLHLMDMTSDEYIEQNMESFSEQFKRNLENIKLMQNEYNRNKLLCASLYLEYLIGLYTITAKNRGMVPQKIEDCPRPIKAKILKEFTDVQNKNRRMSKANRSKLLCYILVLVLIVNGFEASLNVLMSTLGEKRSSLEKILVVIGTRAMERKDLVVLKLPLVPLPQSKQSSTSKKRRRY